MEWANSSALSPTAPVRQTSTIRALVVIMTNHAVELPVVVLERETGDMKAIETFQQLREFVDEFSDILDDDFAFWDSAGFKLGFEDRFTARQDNSGIVILGNAAAELVALITHCLHMQSAGDTAERLELILERLVRQRGPAEER